MVPRKTEQYNQVSSLDESQDDSGLLPAVEENNSTPEENGLAAVMSEPSSSVDDGADVKQKLVPHERGSGSDEDSENELIITVDEAIERLGMGRFQYFVLVAAGFCFAADAMQVLLFSFLSEIFKDIWGLTEDETASITSILFAGSMLGTLILGPLADKWGRHPVFLIAASVIAFFGLAVGFVTTYWTLLPVVFMIGVGVGGLTVPFDILAEFLPADSRGKNLLLIEYFWTVGTLYVVAMAYLTLGGGVGGGNAVNWRLFAILTALPCTISIVLGCWLVPESPRWLCTVHRCDEALEIIRHAAKTNGRDVDFIFPPGTALEAEKEEDSSFLELVAPKWRWTMLRLWGLWGAMAFGYYGILMSTTRIFASEGNSSSANTTLLGLDDAGLDEESPTFDYGAIFLSCSAELVGITFVMLLVDIAGRIPLQIISFSIGGTCLAALCILAAQGAPRKILIALSFTARIFEMAASCVTWVSTAEILPTEIRTTGHSTANAVARIASIMCPFLVEDTPLVTMGLVMLGIHLFSVLCVSRLPETKGSRMGGSSNEGRPTEEAVGGVSNGIVVSSAIDHQQGQQGEDVARDTSFDESPRQLI